MNETTAAAEPVAKPYPLGVLFVHGIGEQPLGDTLKSAVDPIVRSLDLWIHGAAIDGSATLRDGRMQLTSGDDACPTHALLQVRTTDAQQQVNEGVALVAESWWARNFVPPTPGALMSWTFRVLPLAMGMHLSDGVRRHGSLMHDDQTGRLRRAGHALQTLGWLLVMMLALPLALPLQGLLAASVLLGLLPLRFVQDAMRALQATLVGTLGDSALLVSSPVSRAMIVGQCKSDLSWLAERCDQVFVVAHSQGCAVSYLALCETLPENLREVTWLGSGLRKLELLRAAERDVSRITAGWLGTSLPFALWALGHNLMTKWSWASAGELLVILGFYIVGVARLVDLNTHHTIARSLSRWPALTLHDVYASSDPVPHGPLFDGGTTAPTTVHALKVHNLASWFGDHTRYWRNLEEVVLPIAWRISAALGVPTAQLKPGDSDWSKAGTRRRQYRVQALVWLRSIVLAGGAWLLWCDAAAWRTLGGTALDQAWAWGWGNDVDARLITSPLRVVLPELVLWVLLPYAVLMLAWRGWELIDQRAFLARTRSSGVQEWLLATVMSAAILTPVSRAVGLSLGVRSAGEPLVVIALGAFILGYTYILLARRDKRPAQFDRKPGPAP